MISLLFYLFTVHPRSHILSLLFIFPFIPHYPHPQMAIATDRRQTAICSYINLTLRGAVIAPVTFNPVAGLMNHTLEGNALTIISQVNSQPGMIGKWLSRSSPGAATGCILTGYHGGDRDNREPATSNNRSSSGATIGLRVP